MIVSGPFFVPGKLVFGGIDGISGQAGPRQPTITALRELIPTGKPLVVEDISVCLVARKLRNRRVQADSGTWGWIGTWLERLYLAGQI